MDTVTAALYANPFLTDEDTLSASSILEVISGEYYRTPIQPHLGTVDFQCYYGNLDSKSGSNYCKCNQGYSGLNCQYTADGYYYLRKVAQKIMDLTWTNYGSASSIEIFDFEVLVSSLRGMLKDPDLLDYNQLPQLVILFEKLAFMENYKIIALQDTIYTGGTYTGKLVHNSIKMFFDCAERMFAKIYLERKKIKTDPSHYRYPNMNFKQILEAEETQRTELHDYSLRVHDASVNFMKEIMYRLGTENSEYTYIGDLAFEFKAAIGYPPDFEGNQYFIRNSDVYWEIPSGMYSNYQTVASSKQQVYIIAIKWFANPYLMNGDTFTQAGTNITSLMTFDGKGNELVIANLTIPIAIVWPYLKSSGFSQEFLKCQYFHINNNKFQKDGCGYAFVSNVQLPCTT
jgi:hypothetical protein